MLFNQLNIGDKVYIIEVVGTFRKTTEYNEGIVTNVSGVYEEPLPVGQFPMPTQPRKRVIDITVQCNGESKKFTIPENKSIITDTAIGLTMATDKQDIVNVVRNQFDNYKHRKEMMAKCDEEMEKCRAILDKLNVADTPTLDNSKEIDQLKNDIADIRQLITELRHTTTEQQ